MITLPCSLLKERQYKKSALGEAVTKKS